MFAVRCVLWPLGHAYTFRCAHAPRAFVGICTSADVRTCTSTRVLMCARGVCRHARVRTYASADARSCPCAHYTRVRAYTSHVRTWRSAHVPMTTDARGDICAYTCARVLMYAYAEVRTCTSTRVLMCARAHVPKRQIWPAEKKSKNIEFSVA